MPAHGRRHKLLASPRKARETRAPGARRLSAGMRAPGVLRRPVHRARHGRQQERRRRQARFPLSSTRFLHLRHSCICRRSASYCEPGASAAQISPTANNLMSTLDTDHTPRTYHTVTYHTHTGVRLPPKCRPSGWHGGRRSFWTVLGAGRAGDPFQPPRKKWGSCLLYTSPSPRDKRQSRMPSSA